MNVYKFTQGNGFNKKEAIVVAESINEANDKFKGCMGDNAEVDTVKILHKDVIH